MTLYKRQTPEGYGGPNVLVEKISKQLSELLFNAKYICWYAKEILAWLERYSLKQYVLRIFGTPIEHSIGPLRNIPKDFYVF